MGCQRAAATGATTLFIDRPRTKVSHLDTAPPTSSFPSGHTAAAVCFYGSVAAIVLWHNRNRWVRVVVVLVCAAIPLTIAAGGHHYVAVDADRRLVGG
jgi:membrane-associated phospholipid phosphatase